MIARAFVILSGEGHAWRATSYIRGYLSFIAPGTFHGQVHEASIRPL